MGMTELEATRTFLAGLDMLGDLLPIESEAHSHYVVQRCQWADYLETLESTSPPWEPAPAPAAEYPWSQVVPGDSVRAPNGTWYPVDSVARLDTERMSVLLVGTGGAKIPSKPSAGDMVPVQRGPAGKAVDVFRAGGLELTALGVGR